MVMMVVSAKKLLRMSVASLLGVSKVSHNSKLMLELMSRPNLGWVSSSTEVELRSTLRVSWEVRIRSGMVGRMGTC